MARPKSENSKKRVSATIVPEVWTEFQVLVKVHCWFGFKKQVQSRFPNAE